MFSFIFGLIGKIFWWTVETIATATVEALLFQKGVIYIAKKKKKKPAMSKKVKSPSKKQRRQASQSSGGYSSLDSLQPGARGHISGPK